MAFSFGMVLNRYEARRERSRRSECDGTAYLRTQLLDEPHRSRLSKLLLEYTQTASRLSQPEITAAPIWPETTSY
jgi:hypothetical protein